MYLGIDFLINNFNEIFVSEVNIGLPGGAREYDLVYKVIFKKSSDVFSKIENLSQIKFKKDFQSYIRELPYFKEIKKLKIWMDGKGPAPNIKKDFPKFLRLEDKWVQYQILKDKFPVIYSQLYDFTKLESYKKFLNEYSGFILKRRLGRGGQGFFEIKNLQYMEKLKESRIPKNFYIVQPYINSSINVGDKKYKYSIRTITFAGNFICAFANLADRLTSNHGIRFYINPSDLDEFNIKNKNFKIIKIVEKAWEGKIFFGKKIPKYLFYNLFEEEIADTIFNIPKKIYNKIIEISVLINKFYQEINYDLLPKCFLEEN